MFPYCRHNPSLGLLCFSSAYAILNNLGSFFIFSRDNGLKAIENLMEKKGKFDYILLETTGLADPGKKEFKLYN